MTCVFGIILALVCPIMFGIQNLLLGMCLFEDSSKNLAYSFCHVLQSMRYQLVVLYDLSLFRGHKKANKKCGVVRIVIGYSLYILPMCSLILLFLFGHTKRTLCWLPTAAFLLDNDVVPAVSLSTLYHTRQSFAHELLINNPQKELAYREYHSANKLLTWDFQLDFAMVDQVPQSYRRYKYWPLKNITDLLKQYNYVGFHDICIYPRVMDDMTKAFKAGRLASKGLNRVAHGYAVKNSSGADSNKFHIR